jgi:hypothetical protein
VLSNPYAARVETEEKRMRIVTTPTYQVIADSLVVPNQRSLLDGSFLLFSRVAHEDITSHRENFDV